MEKNGFLVATPMDISGKVFESKEERVQDEIFCTFRPNNIYNDYSIGRDDLYNEPDYTVHVVSNMGNDLYSLNERNIPLPIRKSDKLNGLGLNRLNKDVLDMSNGQGVYIIERFNIYDVTSINAEKLLKYYRDYTGLSKELLDTVENDIYRCTRSNFVNMRLVTYIPKSEIDYYKYIYVPNTNICILKGDPNSSILHPNSRITKVLKEDIRIDRDDSSTVIRVDITNNKDHYKPYYMVIGNNVHRIISKPSEVNSDGLKIYFKKDDVLLKDRIDYSLHEMEYVGIYEREENAKYKGDVKAILQDKQMELENSKIDISRRKLILESDKIYLSSKQISHEEKIHEIEIEMKLLSYKTSVFKAEMDYATIIIGMDRERAIYKQKLRQEEYKEVGNMINLTSTAIKFFTTLI